MARLDFQSVDSKDIHLLFLYGICASPKAPKLPPTGTRHPRITLKTHKDSLLTVFNGAVSGHQTPSFMSRSGLFELPMLPSIKSQQLLRGEAV